MTSLIKQNSTLNRVAKSLSTTKVRTGRGVQSVKVAQPAYQTLKEHKHLSTYFTQTLRSIPSNLFTNNGAKYTAELEAGSFTKLKSVTLKLTVTATGGEMKLAPVPYWFNRIEFRSGTKHLGIVYGDNLMFNLGNLSGQQLKNTLKNANMEDDFRPYGRSFNTIATGQSRTYYLPLVNTFINNSELYMKALASDITIDIYPENGIVIQGAGTPTLNDFQLICETESLTNDDEKLHDSYHKSVISSNRYLDVVPVNFYNHTLTAGQETKLELDSVHGDVSGMLMIIRNTGVTNVNNGLATYVGLGDSGTLDVLDSGSRSIFGNGVPLDVQYLKNEVWASHYNNDFSQHKHFYWIPFGGSSRGAFAGQVDGIFPMRGERNFLAVTPASAGVAPVQTINTSESSTSGWFRLSFRGEMTYPINHSATEAQIKTAFENLRTVKYASPEPLSVSVTGTFDAGTSVVITFDQQVDLAGDVIHFHSEGIAGVAPIQGTTLASTS